MDEVNDQVQQDSQPTPEVGPKVLTKNEFADQASQEQSETTKDVANEEDSQVFEDHLGRKLTPEQLHEEYMKTQSYVSKLEKERLEWEKGAQKEAQEAVAENPLLKDVDPNVRAAIVDIVTPVIQDHLRAKDVEAQQRAQDEAFSRTLVELEGKYKGGDGLPKFDRIKVLAAMQDPSNSIFDPEAKFKMMHWETFMDHYSKQAMKGKSSDVETETTGSSQPRKPDGGKSPRTWEEAARGAYNRLSQ